MSTKFKLWSAFKSEDFETLTSALEHLLNQAQKCDQENEGENKEEDKSTVIGKSDVMKIVNDPDEDGNTMLHLAAISGHLKTIWILLDMGSDPSKKNKKLQTPYVISNDKETRNTFRRYMGTNPDKFNYTKVRYCNKSQHSKTDFNN